MRVIERMQKVLGILLCLCMVLSYVPVPAVAAEVCTHHVHDDKCGYVQAVEGSDCTFVCTECKAEEKTCTCESTDPGEHAPFCDLYVRTYEECKCVLNCAQEGLNTYCETCYFEGVDACAASGEEEASAYLTEGTDYTITNGKLVIHDGVTKIDDYAFYGKTISSVVIPTSVTTIGNYAFYYCSKLTAVTIAGNSSLTIGDYAFYYCSNLSSVTYQSTSAPASIGYKAFYGAKAKSVDVPSGFPTNYSFGGLSLNIVGGGPVAVESVTFKRNGNDAGSRVSMTCKAPMQLTADISPANADNKKVTWTQAEQNGAKPFLTIANDGTITATFAGYTAADFEPFVYGYYSDVTVTTEDGSKTDTVTVEVNRYTLVIKDGETEKFRLPRPAGYALSGLIPAEYSTPSKPGYIFKGWKRAYEKADGTMDYDNLIKSLPATMPHTSASNAAHEQIYVEQWEVDPDVTFAVNVSNTTGGMVTANHSAAAAETVITLTVNVSNGYELEGFTDGTNAITTTKVDDTTYTFVMPNRDVTVTPVYKSLHQHQWAYSVNAAKDTITAACTAENCLNTDGGSVTIYAPKHSVYGDGKEEQASYKWTMVYPTTGSTIFYEKKTENGTWENITQAPTDAGTYKASLTVDIIEKTISVEYTIEKAAPVITWDSTTASTNYTGSETVITAPVITLANGETFNGTISYSYTGTSSGNGLPTNAGTYEIAASIEAQGNYTAATSSNTLELTINKVDPSYTVPTGLTATYGDTLADVALPDGFSWANSSESVGAVGTKNTTVIYTPADTTNYNTVTNIAVSVEVKAAAATVTKAPTANTLTYTGSAQDLINAGSANGGKLVYSLSEDGEFIETIPAGTNAGEYTVWYYVVGDDNHADSAKGSVKVTITKAKATITVDTTTINITYGETVTLPEATTNFGTVTCDKIAADLVNAGTYTVTYTVAGTDNYDGDTKTLTVKVEKKAVAEPTITGTYTYTGSEQTVALTGVESYMTVASGNKGTNAGNYEVEITLDNNHKWADGSDGKVQWSIGKAQAGISVNTDTITVTYGETVTLPTATANFGTVVCDKTAADLVNAGTYTVTYTVEGTTNFEGDTKSITVIVNAKSITVTADAVSKTYGEADPTLTYKVEGLVNGDELTGELKRVAGENVGDYAIEQNTLTAGNNYRLTYTGAKLTINAKAITAADVKLNGGLTYNGREQIQPITVAEGITYEVSGNKATNAGAYELTVKGTGNYTGSVTLDWTIAKAKLTITADSKVIYIGEKVPTLTYTASGLVGGDKLTKEPVLTTNADADQAGSYTITAANADAGDNYTITYVSGSLTIMDKETKVKTRIEITELTVVPDGLKDTEFNTIEAITEELVSRILVTDTGYTAENVEHYDVVAQFSLDGGNTWQLFTEETLPTEGITVILPYPEGTNARDYDFVVSHMFSVNSQRLGITAGDVELPKVEETANGIRVTLNGLSPVTVAARYHNHTGGTATCTEKAICSICGNAYGELDSTNHAGDTEVKDAKEAACGAAGYTGDTYCKGCNEVVEKGTIINATGEHTYSGWKIVKEATKTAKGEKQRTCDLCGHVDSEEIPQLSDIPATGDDSNIMLYGSMFTMSLAALAALLLASKKRRQEIA